MNLMLPGDHMKKLLAVFILAISTQSYAQIFDAISTKELLQKIDSTDFTFKGKGRIFGYESSQSCLFVSEEIAILKNYCSSSSNGPARSFTVISKEFGMVEFYQEKISTIVKKDIRILDFAEIFKPLLINNLKDYTLSSISQMIENHYNLFRPGCWSTNFDRYTEEAMTKCSGQITLSNFEEWSQDNQQIVNNHTEWSSMMDSISSKLKNL